MLAHFEPAYDLNRYAMKLKEHLGLQGKAKWPYSVLSEGAVKAPDGGHRETGLAGLRGNCAGPWRYIIGVPVSNTLTSMLAFTPGPAGFGVEYVIGGQALTSQHRESAAQMLAEDAMRIRCGESPILKRWRAKRDGHEPATRSTDSVVATYAGIGFGLPDKKPATPDHLQGLDD